MKAWALFAALVILLVILLVWFASSGVFNVDTMLGAI